MQQISQSFEKTPLVQEIFKAFNTFFDIYKILDQRNSHFIKDVWKNIADFNQKKFQKLQQNENQLVKDNKILSKQIDFIWPLQILILKAGNNQNKKVYLTCLSHIFKGFDIENLIGIENFENFMFFSKEFSNILVHDKYFCKTKEVILNCKHQARMSNFFVKILNKEQNIQKVEQYCKGLINNYLSGLEQKIQAVDYILKIFKNLNHLNAKFIGQQELEVLNNIIKVDITFIPIEKKVTYLQSILKMIYYHLEPQIDLSQILEVIFQIPFDAYRYRKISDSEDLESFYKNYKNFQEFNDDSYLFLEKLGLIVIKNLDINNNNQQILQNWVQQQQSNLCNQNSIEFYVKCCYLMNIYQNNMEFFVQPSQENIKNILNQNFQIQNLFAPFFEKEVSQLYSNCYRKPEENNETIKQYNYFLQNFVFDQPIQTQQYFYNQTLKYIDDIFGFLFMNLSEKSELDHKLFVSFIENLFKLGFKREFLNKSNSYMNQMQKFQSELFIIVNNNFTMQNSENLSFQGMQMQLLAKSLLPQLLELEYSQNNQINEQFYMKFEQTQLENICVLLQKIQIIKKLKQFNQNPAFFKDFILLYYTLLGVSALNFNNNTLQKEFQQNLLTFFEESQDLADNFDKKEIKYLFTLNRLIYNLCVEKTVNEENVDFLSQQYYDYFVLCINMIQKPYTSKIVENFYDFVLDTNRLPKLELLLKNGTFDKIVKYSILKTGKNINFIHRKVTNNLYKLLEDRVEFLPYFKDSLQEIAVLSELRGLQNSIEYHEYEFQLQTLKQFKQRLNKNEYYLYGVYPRYLMLYLYEKQIKNIEESKEDQTHQVSYILNIFNNMLDTNFNKTFSQTDSNIINTEIHNQKIYLWQTIALLKQILSKKILQKISNKEEYLKYITMVLVPKIKKLFETNTQANLRQYQEILLIHLVLNFPEQFKNYLVESLQNTNSKTLQLLPIAFVSGFCMCRLDNYQAVFEQLNIQQLSTTTYVRITSQYFCYHYLQKQENQKILDSDITIKNQLNFMTQNNELAKMRKNFQRLVSDYQNIITNFNLNELLQTDFDGIGIVNHGSLINQIKDTLVTDFELDKKKPIRKYEQWLSEANRLQNEYYEQVGNQYQNYQIKYENIQEEKQIQQVQQQSSQAYQRELIIVATLIDRIPNFAHLTRTSEVFKATSLIVPNKNIVNDKEYKAISMSAEKWLPISEVKPQDLMGYLLLQKKKGFQICGLEQASKSQNLQDFQFPDKTILLLGNEAQGMPNEFFDILDHIIEIPQFGKIGSLNVHVSGILCLWEYTKQKVIKKQE